MKHRREFLKTGAIGAVGLAGAGLLTPALAATTNKTSAAHSLKPLYSKKAAKARSLSLPKTVAAPSQELRALRRLSFGIAPGDLNYFNSLGANFDIRLSTWVNEQLNSYQPGYPPSQANDPDLYTALNATNVTFPTLDDSLTTLWQERVVADPPWEQRAVPAFETQRIAFVRAAYSRWQLAEILADFWHTHFSVDGLGFVSGPTFVHYDRDVIRVNMLGNFRAMLEAVTKSTAMMFYLDNVSNTRFGPNENYARELQELHTLGAVHSYGFTDEAQIPNATTAQFAGSAANASFPTGMKAGYSEDDVASVTRALTGWSISNEFNDELNSGQYLFHSDWHEFNNSQPKRVMGVDIPSNGEQEVHTILDMLAMHPNTARYVCEKLCRRLISDDPPTSIVEAAAFTFNNLWNQSNQLTEVVKTIVLSNEFKDVQYWGAKVKRPFETVAGAMRCCGLNFNLTSGDTSLSYDHALSQYFAWAMNDTGHMPFTWPTPDGFPDVQEAWSGSTPLIMTWHAINWLFNNNNSTNPFPIDAVATTKSALPVAANHTANNIIDYWIERILGSIPTDADFQSRRAYLIDFLRQNATVNTPLLLDNNDWNNDSSQAYVTQRLQATVAAILMLPENMLR